MKNMQHVCSLVVKCIILSGCGRCTRLKQQIWLCLLKILYESSLLLFQVSLVCCFTTDTFIHLDQSYCSHLKSLMTQKQIVNPKPEAKLQTQITHTSYVTSNIHVQRNRNYLGRHSSLEKIELKYHIKINQKYKQKIYHL